MRDIQAINAGDITTIGVGVIIALVVIGILLSLVITAVIGRVIVAVVVIVLAAFVWQQRASIQDKIKSKDCHFSATFFGIHVKAPQSVVDHCPGGLKN